MFKKEHQIAILIFMAAATGAIYYYQNYFTSVKLAPLEAYAVNIIEVCRTEKYRPGCYDKEIPKLMDFIPMEDAFQVTRLVQEKDREFAYCHVLGHNLSANETAKDPNKWKDVVTRCPSGLCSNGCIHGAFQERFRVEALSDSEIDKLKPDFKDVCEKRGVWEPTSLEQASCYHALGHLLMYVTEADIDKSLALCREVALHTGGRDYRQLCFDGTFMQIFQPLEPEDFSLVAGKQPKKEELAAFCGVYSGQEYGSCWSEGWPLWWKEISTPKGLFGHCSAIKDPGQSSRCFTAMFYVLTPQLGFAEEKITPFCKELPKNIMSKCFANAASRMLETDYRNAGKAAGLCKIAEDNDVGYDCYSELLLYSTYNFRYGSPEFYKMCFALPDYWREKCETQAPK